MRPSRSTGLQVGGRAAEGVLQTGVQYTSFVHGWPAGRWESCRRSCKLPHSACWPPTDPPAQAPTATRPLQVSQSHTRTSKFRHWPSTKAHLWSSLLLNHLLSAARPPGVSQAQDYNKRCQRWAIHRIFLRMSLLFKGSP